jgi:nucleoside-diphosphate-sugar epimerase
MNKRLFTNRHIVIFGCGYVGSALADRLMQNGYHVSALTRNSDKALELRMRGLRNVVCERLESDAWHSALKEPVDAWINCVSSAGNGLDGYRLSYVEGMRSIFGWSDRYQSDIKCAIYTSSTSVYPQDNGEWVDEAADCFAAPQTGKILLEAEQIFLHHPTSYPCHVLRLAGIYGPQRSYLIRQLQEQAEVLPGRGDYILNSIHRDDCVSAILQVLFNTSEKTGDIFNVADDQPLQKQKIMEWLATELNLAAPRFDPEIQSERALRRGGKMPNRRISNAKIKRRLGWNPQYSSCLDGYREIISTQA